MAGAKDLYGTFGSVPDVAPSTSGGTETLNVRATPGAFGGQVGEAMQEYGGAVSKAASEAADLGNKYAKMATEAKANESIVNDWAPQAAQLRANFDNLQGQDKINGYDSYIRGLQAGGNKFIESAGSPYEQQIRSQWVTRHIANEIDGARREQVSAIQQFEDDARGKKLLLHQKESIDNYQDPDIIGQNKSMSDAEILKHYIDQGANPNDPAEMGFIQRQQKALNGQTAAAMTSKAISDGNIDRAAQIYDQNKQDIPGHQQLAIDNTLHIASIGATSENNARAILAGQPLPDGVGRPPIGVQIAVAKAAGDAGIDPNQALTIARIESNYGQNVGKRGDIGQTGKPGTLEEQSANMVSALKTAAPAASNALGRQAEPWEQYVVYQQGVGGGPALLKAATATPNARAVDVLRPFYKNPNDALDAVANNGGNSNMTSGQFLDFIKQKYNAASDRAKCEIPGSLMVPQYTQVGQAEEQVKAPPSMADAMAQQHVSVGAAVQPGVNPKQDLANFDKIYTGAIAQAQMITNVGEREGTIKSLDRQRSSYVRAAQAFDTVLNDQLETYFKNPKFTDQNMIPPELRAQLTYEQLNRAERVAENNLASSAGVSTKDMKEYGPGMYDLMRDVSTNKIKNANELLAHLPDPRAGKTGDITIAGYNKLATMFAHDPDSKADLEMQTHSFKVIKRMLSGEDEALGIKDPKGEEIFGNAMPKLFKALEEGKAKGLTMGQMTSTDSPDWIGKAVMGMKRSLVQQNMDMMHSVDPTATGGAPAARTATDILREYQSTTDPQKRAELEKEGIKLGYFRERTAKPEAPISE